MSSSSALRKSARRRFSYDRAEFVSTDLSIKCFTNLRQSANHQSKDATLLGICSVIVDSWNYCCKIVYVFLDLPITWLSEGFVSTLYSDLDGR